MGSKRTTATSRNILKPSRWREYLAILLAVMAALLMVALITYDNSDWDRTASGHPENAIGRVGVMGSYILFHGIGISVYAFPVLVLVLALMIFMRFRFPSIRTIVLRLCDLLLLLITAASLAHIIHPAALGYPNIPSAGGIIGKNITETILIPFCGVTGSVILLTGLALIEVLFLFDTSLRNLAGFFKVLAGISMYALGIIGAVCRWTGRVLASCWNWSGARVILFFKAIRFRHKKVETRIVITGRKFERTKKNTVRTTKPMQAQERVNAGGKTEAGEDGNQEDERHKTAEVKGLSESTSPNLIDIQELDSEDDELPPYQMPDPDELDEPEDQDTGELEQTVARATEKLKQTLEQFGIEAVVGSAICGPVITCYEVQPAPGVKVSKITSLENDLALAMKAKSIRIIAPIPGRDAVGIELPNERRRLVTFSELIHSPGYIAQSPKMKLLLSLGQTLSGETFNDDMADMPHLLVAGATGSGKSVCINTILLSLLFRFKPNELKLILVDPKHVELVPYHNLPHLLVPVLNDPAKVPDALEWLIEEMEKRYKYFARLGVRNIDMFNQKRKKDAKPLFIQLGGNEKELPTFLPYIVVIIDELADLMMVAAEDVERKIIRLAQLARAAGIHMVLATQRPSTNVITGLIKANIPARIAFRTTSNVDSRVIIDEPGSEKLLGKGDMLYKSPSVSRTLRIQGAFVSEEEVKRITDFIREQRAPHYVDIGSVRENQGFAGLEMDEKFDEAIYAVLESGQASASYLQRRLQVGYARAARLVDLMEANGIVGPKRGAKPRDILVEEWPPQ